MWKRSGVAISVVALLVGCGSSHWNDKASLNERVASDRVGGFSEDDKHLYHLGLQHVINTHQKIGSLTIGDVVNQERNRESRRDDARAQETQRAADAASHRLDAKATANLESAIQLANSTGPHMYRGAIMDGTNCGIKIDGDYYEGASDQDKTLIQRTVIIMCSGSYTALGAPNNRKLPRSGLFVRIYDLANNVIYRDVITPRS